MMQGIFTLLKNCSKISHTLSQTLKPLRPIKRAMVIGCGSSVHTGIVSGSLPSDNVRQLLVRLKTLPYPVLILLLCYAFYPRSKAIVFGHSKTEHVKFL